MGLPGNAGLNGPAGATGAVGSAGAGGGAGAVGAVGPAGAAGATGATGAVGLAGTRGATGATGPAGPAGAAGATGSPGLAGARGPTGASGPAGAAGAQGGAGATGPVGAIGASGTNGPAGNHFALDTTLHASGYIIPDTDAFLYYLTNNPVGTASTCGTVPTISLPHATTVGSGRVIIISPGNVPNPSAQCSGVSVVAQGTDTIVPSGANDSAHPLTLVSDGAGHWILMNSDGR